MSSELTAACSFPFPNPSRSDIFVLHFRNDISKQHQGMIKSASIQNFMGHQSFKADQFAPVNIFIGKNDTGKTGLLKLLYASLKAVDEYGKKKGGAGVTFKKSLSDKLLGVFESGHKGLGELVRKPDTGKLAVELELENESLKYHDRLRYSFGESTTSTLVDANADISTWDDGVFSTLFFPAKEVLTMLKSLRKMKDYEKSGFDYTYYDLLDSLSIPNVKGNIAKEHKEINANLEKLIGGKVEQKGEDEFVFKKGKLEFSMEMTAEGIKKIAPLHTLIRNRQLKTNSVLFFDEPETNMHPFAVRELMKMVMLHAQRGGQVFLATHNYFVIKELHILARKSKSMVNCYSIERCQNGQLAYNTSDLQQTMPDNPISEEAIKMSDDELELDFMGETNI